MKPEIGQVLYSLNIGNAARNKEKKLTQVVVKKVGRKYFTCGQDGWPEHCDTQYYISDWREKSNYSANSKLYEDAQKYRDETEIREICWRLHRAFEYGRNLLDIELADLRKIANLLDCKPEPGQP